VDQEQPSRLNTGISVHADVTRLIGAVEAGAPRASDELLELVYAQLRAIAQQRMAEERTGHTLQATALVHEAYLRLLGDQPLGWANRAHFFHAAAEAMRRILIEHARARARVKRGGEAGKPARRVPLNVLDLADTENSETVLSLDEALCRRSSGCAFTLG
jgi:RNA polymerase sigma factor (TIGR02999 family)